MHKLNPCLWFSDNIEEAVDFYCSVFGQNAKKLRMMRYPESMPAMAGKVLTIEVELFGQFYLFLNGGPQYQFTPAISLQVHCESQAELDHYWSALSPGGSELQCGWLTDRFGLTWQIFPARLPEMIQDPDPERANRVFNKMCEMVKFDFAELERAYNGA